MAYGGSTGGRPRICVRRRRHFARHRYGFLDAQPGWVRPHTAALLNAMPPPGELVKEEAS